MPSSRAAAIQAPATDTPRSVFSRPLSSNLGLYRWYFVLAGLDILLTGVILMFGGSEVNAFADRIYEDHGVAGLAMLKVLSVGIVLACCELIRLRRPSASKRVAEWAVALTSIPVVVAATQIGFAVVLHDRGETWIAHAEKEELLLDELAAPLPAGFDADEDVTRRGRGMRGVRSGEHSGSPRGRILRQAQSQE